jgi:heme oxygenase
LHQYPAVVLALREKTMPLHDRFTSWSVDIFNGTISRDRYLHFLKLFYGFYSPLERLAVARNEWREIPFDFRERLKSSLLEDDMRVFGMSAAEIHSVKVCKSLPVMKSFPQILGGLYVIEGATIGGQHIYQKLHELKFLNGEGGASFFYSYGDQVMPMWATFCKLLGQVAAEKEVIDEVVQSAIDTYNSLGLWLGQST